MAPISKNLFDGPIFVGFTEWPETRAVRDCSGSFFAGDDAGGFDKVILIIEWILSLLIIEFLPQLRHELRLIPHVGQDIHVFIMEIFWDEIIPKKDEDENHDYLEERLEDDVLDHGWGDDGFLAAAWRVLEESLRRWLSRQDQRSQGIHNKVDPEQLRWSENGIVDDDRTQEGDGDCYDVDGELEL